MDFFGNWSIVGGEIIFKKNENMKIKKLRIKNFRHFKKFELNLLDENFSLIV